jgi:hypothetical protein
MSDLISNFWNGFDACLNELRAERIASERVTTLHPDMKPQQRAHFAMRALVDALDQLEMVADEVMLNGGQMEALEGANSRLALLCPRARMRRSMLHLTSEMGRAP